jgi:hypothetical protein
MQTTLNTLETRKLVEAALLEKDAAFWNSWTNKCYKDFTSVKDKRNLCFGIIGDKFTAEDCAALQSAVGCDKVHTTANGRYLRLLGVRYAI